MANFETSAGIDSLTGKLNSRERIVMRQKKYRLPSGRIIKLGPKEAYVKERRDYKRSPLTEKEKAQKALWTEVCREGSVSCTTRTIRGTASYTTAGSLKRPVSPIR